tara:strand:+ start:193 stop:753 length:561 start_codon:yes stop_codon:yes gene_type:complete
MPTFTQLKRKVSLNEKRVGVPLYIQRRREKFGSFNQIKKLTKSEEIKSTNTESSPKSNFKRVMAQLKTNAARKAYDTTITKRPGIKKIRVPQHSFPVFPCTRKGRGGEVLSVEEKNKKLIKIREKNRKEKEAFLSKGYSYDDWLFNESEIQSRCAYQDLDLDKIEEELDYGSDPEDEIDEVEVADD